MKVWSITIVIYLQFRYQNLNDSNQLSSDQEPLSYNDTQTLRADQKLEYPPPLKEPNQFITNGDIINNQQTLRADQVDSVRNNR